MHHVWGIGVSVCSEIEAKTRAALGQTDINDIYDKEQVDTDVEDLDGLSEAEAWCEAVVHTM